MRCLDGVSINRTGYWLLVRVSESAPIRLSEIADSVDLDLFDPASEVWDLVVAGLLAKVPDPADGRASLLRLTAPGTAVLESVSEARRRVLAEAIADWTDEERSALASGLLRLGAGLQHVHNHDEGNRWAWTRHRGATPGGRGTRPTTAHPPREPGRAWRPTAR